jgi:branched-chain amino acid transport system substrate-binding protein
MIGGSRYTPTYDSPENKAFVAAWQAEYKRPPQMFEGDQYQSCVVMQAGIEKAGSFDTAKIRTALEGLKLTSVKGPLEMRACDHQAAQQGFVVRVVKSADGKGVIPQVIATYPADKITPACNKTDYAD